MPLLTGETLCIEVHETRCRNLLRIPDVVTEVHLQELRFAGFEVDKDVFGELIAKAPGAPWFNPAAYELGRLTFRRKRR